MEYAQPVRRLPQFIALAMGLLILSSSAQAAVVSVTAIGTIDFVAPELAGAFSTGDTWTMNYSFESTTSARAGGNSNFAVFDALLSTDFSTNSYAGSATGSEEIQVDNDPGGGDFDRYSPGPGAASVVTGADVNGLTLNTFYFVLTDSTDTAFSDALILPTDLSLANFDSNFFTIDFTDALGNVYSVTGGLTSLTTTTVPEPGSAILAASAIVAMLGYVRRQRA